MSPNLVAIVDYAIAVIVRFRQRDEPVRCAESILKPRSRPKQLRPIIDFAVAIAVERQKRFVATTSSPTDSHGMPRIGDIEQHRRLVTCQLIRAVGEIDNNWATLRIAGILDIIGRCRGRWIDGRYCSVVTVGEAVERGRCSAP